MLNTKHECPAVLKRQRNKMNVAICSIDHLLKNESQAFISFLYPIVQFNSYTQ